MSQRTSLPLYTSGFPLYKHALRREEGKGGGDTQSWAHLRVLPSGLMGGVFRDTLFQHSGDTRGSLEREQGTHNQPTESHGPGLSFDFLLPVQALWVRGLGQALADGGLRAAAVQAVQVGPGLL